MYNGGDRPDGSECGDSLGLTDSLSIGSMDSQLHSCNEISNAGLLLAPLRLGKPVVLSIDDPRLPKRKRVEKPLLFLTPVTLYGAPSKLLLVSLQTHGCEIVDTSMEIQPLALMRVGISPRLAKALAGELDLVFKKGR